MYTVLRNTHNMWLNQFCCGGNMNVCTVLRKDGKPRRWGQGWHRPQSREEDAEEEKEAFEDEKDEEEEKEEEDEKDEE